MLNRRKKRERENEQLKSQVNQCRKLSGQAVSTTELLDLSSAMIIEILTRTPISDILNCRCVCKPLRDLISDPAFVENFISRTPFLSILHRTNDKNYLSVNLLGDSYNSVSTKLVNTSFIPDPKSFCLQMIGCANGLICFRNKYSLHIKNFYITNPVLREFAVVPNPKSDKYSALEEIYGFCSHPNPGEYKIVKIKTKRAYPQPNQVGYYRKTEVWILDVGSDRWRYVGDAPFPYGCRGSLVFLNGCFHWIADHDMKGLIKLHSLDFVKEQAHPFPAPSELSCKNNEQELGVLQESLCLFDSSSNSRIVIWSMREYGVATSWTKDWIVAIPIRLSMFFKPLAVEENGMILISYEWGSIYCYDPKERKYTEVYDFICKSLAHVTLYTPSFLSLKHVFSGTLMTVRKVVSDT